MVSRRQPGCKSGLAPGFGFSTDPSRADRGLVGGRFPLSAHGGLRSSAADYVHTGFQADCELSLPWNPTSEKPAETTLIGSRFV